MRSFSRCLPEFGRHVHSLHATTVGQQSPPEDRLGSPASLELGTCTVRESALERMVLTVSSASALAMERRV